MLCFSLLFAYILFDMKGPGNDKSMIWDQSRKSMRPEFDAWQELTDEGESDLRMQYCTLVHYDTCSFPSMLGDFAEYFNRVSQLGATVGCTGTKVVVKGFKESCDFRFACE